jgi:ferric-dicitrate binding protein FerR (iron transport regulator)
LADRTSSLIGAPDIGSPPVTSSTLTRRPARRRAARASIIALAGALALLHGASGSTPAGAGEAHYAIAMHGEPA